MENVKTTAEKIVENISKDLVVLKLVEECTELSEVLVKYLTKAEGMKPTLEKITEEMGDVLFRMDVVMTLFKNKTNVEERYVEKARQINDWIDRKIEDKNKK
jgi:NTP pyrophosphatase (non-canonical NTP hydrolase)